jgi:hypothetical protein
VRVTFTRLTANGLHSIRVVRDDGVVLSVNGYSRKGYIPHDMQHFVAERSFGVTNGFWGSIADGALFQSVQVVEGRLRHDAWAKSKALIKANTEGFRFAEVVAGPAYIAVERGWDLETAFKALGRAWGIFSAEPVPYDRDVLAGAITAFGDARQEWEATPIGGDVALTWRQPSRRR